MSELVNEAEFFAPAATDLIDGLIGRYQHMRGKVERVAAVMNGPDLAGALRYFAQHAASYDRQIVPSEVEKMFNLPGALAQLNAAYWSKAMHLTDVLDAMPQARRDAWHAQIRNPLGAKKNSWDKVYEVEPIPEFSEDNVRSTIMGLLSQRETFFAERVDGIFRGLSKTHITNAPEGFGRRMILAGAIDSYGLASHSICGVINDLRCVIAKFMGRDEPGYDASSGVVRYARTRPGEWLPVDGGAMRIRVYKVGTAHLEVHPDMAWRLNCILAKLYPLAIPSNFRERPKKKLKDFVMMGRPLPFKVLASLATLKQARDLNPTAGYRQDTYVTVPGCYDLSSNPPEVKDELARVLQSLGGVQVSAVRWAFDYNPTDAVQEVVASGCLPDQKTHQYYPTPEKLARIAVEIADIGEEHLVLEPSAGMGGLADLLPKDRTTCVEISALHCKVLKAKGYDVVEGDFLKKDTWTFARIVMNPPFSSGRWQAHTEHAAKMLAKGGKLVSILPASARNSFELPGMVCKWHGPYDNEFAGTSVSVVILEANHETN